MNRMPPTVEMDVVVMPKAEGARRATGAFGPTAARPGLRRQSRVAHAAPDGRGHAAEPPGPRFGAGGGADRPPDRLLGACAALLGPGTP